MSRSLGPCHLAESRPPVSRPIRYTAGEVASTIDRAKHLISIAEATLADVPVGKKDGFTRFLKKEPLGVVAVISPWNVRRL